MASKCDRRAIVEASLAPTRTRIKEIVAEMRTYDALNTELDALRYHCRVTINNFEGKEIARGISKKFDIDATIKNPRMYVITRTKNSGVLINDFLYHLQKKEIPEIYIASSRRDEIYFNTIPNTSDIFVSDLQNVTEELKAIYLNQRLRVRRCDIKKSRIAIVLDVDNIYDFINVNELLYMFIDHSPLNMSIIIVTCNKIPIDIKQNADYMMYTGKLPISTYNDLYSRCHNSFSRSIFSEMYKNITKNNEYMVLDNNVFYQHFMDCLYRYKAKTIDENIYEDAAVKAQSIVRMYIGFKVAQAMRLLEQSQYNVYKHK